MQQAGAASDQQRRVWATGEENKLIKIDYGIAKNHIQETQLSLERADRFWDTATNIQKSCIKNCGQNAAHGDMVTAAIVIALSNGSIADPLRLTI